MQEQHNAHSSQGHIGHYVIDHIIGHKTKILTNLRSKSYQQWYETTKNEKKAWKSMNKYVEGKQYTSENGSKKTLNVK